MIDTSLLFKDPEPGTYEAGMQFDGFTIKACDGSTLLARMLSAGRKKDELCPAVLLLHGFPGNEQNMDMAQSLRRAGFTVFTLHYRGNWGSGGEYRLAHLPEDAESMLKYMKAGHQALGIDPERIFLLGHSMGGFTAFELLSRRVSIAGAVLMAPCDIEYMYTEDRAAFSALVDNTEDYFRLDSSRIFYEECAAHTDDWRFTAFAQKADPSVPLLFVGGTEDVTCDPEHHIAPARDILLQRGADAECLILEDGHCFDSHRCRLITAIAEWLAKKVQ